MSTDLIKAINDSSIAIHIRESATLFPWIEGIHVLAITIVVGTIAIVDLRLLGFQAHRKNAEQLIKELLPFTWIMFVTAVATGTLMFISNASTYWINTQFRIKLFMILLAGLNMAFFHLTAYRKIGDWAEASSPPTLARVAGATSLSLWILTIFFGRWIGFTLTPGG